MSAERGVDALDIQASSFRASRTTTGSLIGEAQNKSAGVATKKAQQVKSQMGREKDASSVGVRPRGGEQ